jgi:uncharacterized protein
MMKKSSRALYSLLSIINKVPSNNNILILEVENDAPDQAFTQNQRLTEINHSNHAFIKYPGLGHLFYPSPKFFPQVGPLPEYGLYNIFS